MADIVRLDNITSLDADFDVTKRKAHEQRLMNAAGIDARRTAENMLQGMSRKLGAVHAISESSFSSSIGLFRLGGGRDYPVAMMAMKAPYSDTVFEPSTIELRQTIQVMFKLK